MFTRVVWTLTVLALAVNAFQPLIAQPSSYRNQLIPFQSAQRRSLSVCFLSIPSSLKSLFGNASAKRATTSAVVDKTKAPPNGNVPDHVPVPGVDGIYHIANQAQFSTLLHEIGADQIVVLKCFAPWCQACKGLEPKFQHISHDPKYQNLPIVWAAVSIHQNKELLKSMGVVALPTIQFYVAGQLYDSFLTGPSKTMILKRRLVDIINQHVDVKTRLLKQEVLNPVLQQQR